MDVYGIITDKIVTLLENGVVPWRRPWASAGLPRNLASKKLYRGVNVFLLSSSKYVSPLWLTLRQANELGGHVRKGEESTFVIYWKVGNVIQEDLDLEKTEEKTRQSCAPRRRSATADGLCPQLCRRSEQSVAALRGFPAHVYVAAKGGIISLTRALAGEYANNRIRANAICPALVKTDRVLQRYGDPDDLDSATPQHRQ
jgi:antirestriction protein ArdC